MPTTPIYGIPYRAYTDSPDIAAGTQNIAQAVEPALQLGFVGFRETFQDTSLASWGDFGAGTYTDLASYTIPVPTWARDGTATVLVTADVSALIIGADATFSVRVATNTTVPPEAPTRVGGSPGTIPGQTAGTLPVTGNFQVVGTFSVGSGATTLTFKPQAERVFGTGDLRGNRATGEGGVIKWSFFWSKPLP